MWNQAQNVIPNLIGNPKETTCYGFSRRDTFGAAFAVRLRRRQAGMTLDTVFSHNLSMSDGKEQIIIILSP